MDLEIEGNGAIVTASSSGLGKASAEALSREGVDVVINGRDKERLAAAAEDVEDVGEGKVIPCQGDITDPDAIERLVDTAVEKFGRLDHLVTNAGPPPRHRFPETTDEDWYQAFDSQVMSVVRLVREASDHLRDDGGGTIVAITSILVKEASHNNVLSSAIRMGVPGLGKTLSVELAPEVRFNSVLPGKHRTPRRMDHPNETEADLREATPLRRIGQPIELGDAVAFLSSPRSGYINGEALTIDGGASSGTL